jgi:hypothetical protein
MRPSIRALERILAVVFGTTLAVGLAVSHPGPVAAAGVTEALLLPVSTGFTWDVCQGYGNNHYAFSHDDPKGLFSLDLSGPNCAINGSPGSAEGERVLSPWWGEVHRAPLVSKEDWVCISIRGGGSVKVGHISTTLEKGDDVTPSTVVGTVNRGGVGYNGSNIPHVHTETYPNATCIEGTGVAFAGAHRMQCAPDLTETGGAGGNGRWSLIDQLTRPANGYFGTPFLDLCNVSADRRSDIKWLVDNGITSGCGAARFCPDGLVARDQLATFLSRFLDLPATSQDFFTDDETNSHEASINKIAKAGITTGCGPGKYCPSGIVLRDQMASFLAKALKLPSTSQDFFTDDETNSHEANINKIAKAGITTGCGSGKYCPSGEVSRQQMAAFLRNAAPLRPRDPPPVL